MTTLNRTFPSTRLRRLRSSPIAATVQENHLLIQDLIYPLFVVEGSRQQAIEAMPEVFRHSLDSLLREVEQAVALGINTFAIFPCVDTALKNDKATEAFNSNNLMVRAVKALKNRFPRVVVIADVALDPYTDHGHDGIVIDDDVANDVTLQALQKMALLLAQSGFDVIAPSDMMDGRVGAIRATLEQNHLPNTIIMSYAAKYNSALYGPFRSALQNTSAVAINKGSYQMHVANSDEAVHEVALDIEEGADCVIIKPAMMNSDIIYRCSQQFKIPVFAYQVSGEYSMIFNASRNNAFDCDTMVLESLLCLKRSGARGIWSYFALRAAKLLR